MPMTLKLPGYGEIPIEGISGVGASYQDAKPVRGSLSITRHADELSPAFLRDVCNGKVYDEAVVTAYGTKEKKPYFRFHFKLAQLDGYQKTENNVEQLSMGYVDRISEWFEVRP